MQITLRLRFVDAKHNPALCQTLFLQYTGLPWQAMRAVRAVNCVCGASSAAAGCRWGRYEHVEDTTAIPAPVATDRGLSPEQFSNGQIDLTTRPSRDIILL